MNRYIALLRGINVGGHKKILMADLRQLFENLGYRNIKSYIQTGNIIFDSNKNEDNLSLAKTIEDAIQNSYGFDVPVIVRTTEELETIVTESPYWKDKDSDIDRLHLTLLNTVPIGENIAILKSSDYSPDRFKIIEKSIYLFCAKQYHTTKLSNNTLEKKLKVKATTRNWKTTLKILELVNI